MVRVVTDTNDSYNVSVFNVSDTECETGLVKVQNVCKETCAVRPCKELIQNICLFYTCGFYCKTEVE